MSVRMQNSAVIDLGINTSGSNQTVTHYRVRYGPSSSRQDLVPWKALTAQQVVGNGRQLRFPVDACDILWRDGDLADAGLSRFVQAAATDSTEG